MLRFLKEVGGLTKCRYCRTKSQRPCDGHSYRQNEPFSAKEFNKEILREAGAKRCLVCQENGWIMFAGHFSIGSAFTSSTGIFQSRGLQRSGSMWLSTSMSDHRPHVIKDMTGNGPLYHPPVSSWCFAILRDQRSTPPPWRG